MAGFDPSCNLPTDMQSILDSNYKAPGCAATRLCCTLGPASRSVEVLEQLLRAGMHIARLDFSWGSREFHQETLDNLRAAMRSTGELCAVMVDTTGPESRVRNPQNGVLEFVAGERVVVTPDESAVPSKSVLPVNRMEVRSAHVGSVIQVGMYLSSGDASRTARLRVESMEGECVTCVVENSVALDGQQLTVQFDCGSERDALTEDDIALLKDFHAANNIEFVGLSFCRSAADVNFCRHILAQIGLTETQVFAKIESIAGLTNHEDILDAADGLVFSRGNLGVQLAPEKTILAQHLLLGAANLRGKPVFVTRLCDSMVEVPRPTRAEATDVANLVLNGADGVILGQETFRGLYPVACATTVMRICDQAERHVNSHMHYLKLMAESGTYVGKRLDYRESLASTAVRAVEKLDAKLIVCFTGTGETARVLAKYKPSVPIIAVVLPALTTDGIKWCVKGHMKARQVLAYRGVIPLLAHTNSDVPRNRGSLLNFALDFARRAGLVHDQDLVVVQECPRGRHSGLVKSLRMSEADLHCAASLPPTSAAPNDELHLTGGP